MTCGTKRCIDLGCFGYCDEAAVSLKTKELSNMHTVTESIFSGSVIVPLADVQHIEIWPKNSVPGIMVITKHTRWDCDRDVWANGIWISDPEAVEFRRAWCRYRSELEADTLMDLTPTADELKHNAMKQSDNMVDALKRA